MTKSEINIYYKGIKQKLKYYGKFNEKSIKTTIKQIFKINEPLEQIFFQDEEGDILSLDEQTPSGISVYIFVEPDAIPKNPSTELKIPKTKEKLVKFHWILDKKYEEKNLDVIKDKYLYTTLNADDTHPSVRSSCTFEKGKHFIVLRKPKLCYYTMIAVTYDNNKDAYDQKEAIGYFDGFPELEESTFAQNLGILIDMDNKKCIFYDYDKKTKKNIRYYDKNKEMKEVIEAPIQFKKVKLVVWLKNNCNNPDNKGITILNEGCIPIPDWV